MRLSRVMLISLLLCAVACTVAFSATKNNNDLTVSMALIPGLVNDANSGTYVDLIKAIDEVYTAGIIIRKAFPFERSINNVINGEADFHVPLLKNPLIPASTLKFKHSSRRIEQVAFVIYSHKDKPLFRKDLDNASKTNFPFKVETLLSHRDYFSFPLNEVPTFEGGLQKVQAKRIDAFIMPQEECDAIIRKMNLNNIHRALYAEFDDMFIVAKNERGAKVDKIVTEALNKLEASGRLKKLCAKIHVSYIEWQPYKEL